MIIYTGQQDPTTGLGYGQTVVLDLADGLLQCHRTVVVDNFFRSVSLTESVLQNDTYLIGTKSNNGVKLIKWKDKRDVLMISTKPSHSTTLIDSGRTNKANQRIMKPSVVPDYNKGKQGIDLSDQLSTYHTHAYLIYKEY